MYGKLNYYIGKRAADEGRQSLFPSIDVSALPFECSCNGSDMHYIQVLPKSTGGLLRRVFI